MNYSNKDIYNKRVSPHRQSGFTIVESLIAITILLIAVVAPMSIISTNLNQVFLSRDQLTAIYLAEEAIEIIRQRRDSNMIAKDVWDAGLGSSDCFGAGIRCIVGPDDFNVPTVEKCTGSGIDCGNLNSPDKTLELYLNSDSIYTHDPTSATKTNFTRVVNVVDLGNDNELKFTATVSWNTGSIMKTISITENLRKWVPY